MALVRDLVFMHEQVAGHVERVPWVIGSMEERSRIRTRFGEAKKAFTRQVHWCFIPA
ncbi:MAG TPA: hypothetical protein VN371_10570 [Chlorobaculum sp.]|nr:hypothetical protein [Chlorobaculum sp.]